MLRAMADGGFQKFVTISGGADGFFFNGPKETKQINAHLKFGRNEYRFALQATVVGEMAINDEGTYYDGPQWPTSWHKWGSGKKESDLPSWKDQKSNRGNWPSVEAHVYDAVSSWVFIMSMTLAAQHR